MNKMKFIMTLILILAVVILFGVARSRTGTQENSYQQISMQEAATMMEKEENYILLDVRTAEEFRTGHIPGAICVPNETIGANDIEKLPDKEQMIFVYCRSGNRSKQAAQKLFAQGYSNLYEIGGIMDWQGEVVSGDE